MGRFKHQVTKTEHCFHLKVQGLPNKVIVTPSRHGVQAFLYAAITVRTPLGHANVSKASGRLSRFNINSNARFRSRRRCYCSLLGFSKTCPLHLRRRKNKTRVLSNTTLCVLVVRLDVKGEPFESSFGVAAV